MSGEVVRSKFSSRKFLLALVGVLAYVVAMIVGAVDVGEGCKGIVQVVIAYGAVEGATDVASNLGLGGWIGRLLNRGSTDE